MAFRSDKVWNWIPRFLDWALGIEFIRFGIVGGLATVLQFAVYYILILIPYEEWSAGWLVKFWPQFSLGLGYVISFVFNFFASAKFTFRKKATLGRGLGFTLSHIVNFGLQQLILWISMDIFGISKFWASVPVLLICVPVNYLLVRLAFNKIK